MPRKSHPPPPSSSEELKPKPQSKAHALKHLDDEMFVAIDPHSSNPSLIGMLDAGIVPATPVSSIKPAGKKWLFPELANQAKDGVGAFWLCPAMPKHARICLRLAASACSTAPIGRRFYGVIRSSGSFKLIATRAFPDKYDGNAVADFQIPVGTYSICIDEEFEWNEDGWVEAKARQTLFTITFSPIEAPENFPPALLTSRPNKMRHRVNITTLTETAPDQYTMVITTATSAPGVKPSIITLGLAHHSDNLIRFRPPEYQLKGYRGIIEKLKTYAQSGTELTLGVLGNCWGSPMAGKKNAYQVETIAEMLDDDGSKLIHCISRGGGVT